MRKSRHLLFLSEYPHDPEKKREGYFQRVLHIDDHFRDQPRIYLHIHPWRFFRKSVRREDEFLKSYQLNLFLHFFLILKIFRGCGTVYIQTIYNLLYPLLFVLLFNRRYFLDLHGVVPEELRLEGRPFFAAVLEVVERMIFPKISYFVSVREALTQHYKSKIPAIRGEFIKYFIMPGDQQDVRVEADHHNGAQTTFIYAGNLQAWQNIDLMLASIKESLNKRYHYTMLTGDLMGFTAKLKEYHLDANPQINLASVSPAELGAYYQRQHYGFVLREDIIINRVACPTKLIEYMKFGLKPVVKSANLGDFLTLGYEYVTLEEFNAQILPPQKSKKNMEIIRNMEIENARSMAYLREVVLQNTEC